MPEKTETTPYRQIRGSFDEETITVYQAYSSEIAIPAVQQQKISASPLFKPTRFTWIKPSWCWMMYRSGYGTKDAHQARILAIRMTHANFEALLREATVTGHSGPLTEEERGRAVRVQWDPERNHKLEVLPYRSVQIGIGGAAAKMWAEHYIESIEDVTEKARKLKRVLEEDGDVGAEELIRMGLVPEEAVYELSGELREVLKMDAEVRV